MVYREPPATIAQLFLDSMAASRAAHLLVRQGRSFGPLSSAELFAHVARLHLGLRSLGLRRGDACALLSENRWEWVVADFALSTVGIVNVALDPDISPQQLRYALADSQCRAVMVSTRAQREKLAAIRDQLPLVESVIAFEAGSGSPTSRVFSAAQWLNNSQVSHYERKTLRESIGLARPADPASVMYKFNVPAAPLATVLNQGDWATGAQDHGVNVSPADIVLCLLPLHDLDERSLHYCLYLGGATLAHANDTENLLPILEAVRPSVIAARSGTVERIHGYATRHLATSPAFRRFLLRKTLPLGHRAAPYWARNESVPLPWGVPLACLDRWVFSKVRSPLGGRVRTVLSSDGPASGPSTEFLCALGLRVVDLRTRQEAPAARKPAEPAPETSRPEPAVESRVRSEIQNAAAAAKRLFGSAAAIAGAPSLRALPRKGLGRAKAASENLATAYRSIGAPQPVRLALTEQEGARPAAALPLEAPDEVREQLWRPLFEVGLVHAGAVLLTALLVVAGLVCWNYQSGRGLGVTGLSRSGAQGLYLASFVFWLGTGASGALLGAYLHLTRASWRGPVIRAAEALTVITLIAGALFPVINLGRPGADYRLWLAPNPASPLTWEGITFVVLLAAGILQLYLSLAPEAAEIRPHALGWQRSFYRLVSFRWTAHHCTRPSYQRTRRWMALVVAGCAVAASMAAGWNLPLPAISWWRMALSGAQFLAGGGVRGVALLLLVLAVVRLALRFEAYLQPGLFEKLGRLLVCAGGLWFLVAAAGHWTASAGQGGAQRAFWVATFCGFAAPAVLVLVNTRRLGSIRAATSAAAIALAGMWLDCYRTVVRNVYSPSGVEIFITVAGLGGFVLLCLVFSKLFPVLAAAECHLVPPRQAQIAAEDDTGYNDGSPVFFKRGRWP